MVPVPSVFFIGNNGLASEVVVGNNESANVEARLLAAIQKCASELNVQTPRKQHSRSDERLGQSDCRLLLVSNHSIAEHERLRLVSDLGRQSERWYVRKRAGRQQRVVSTNPRNRPFSLSTSVW
ncbi:unnamed protein product, partial [Nesidiocoris tenuis]